LGNLSTPNSVQKLQKALHAKAKAVPCPWVGQSTLIGENVRVFATPLLTMLSVLANNYSKTHTCVSIAIVAGHAKPEHSLTEFISLRRRWLRTGSRSDFNASRAETDGLSKQLAAQSRH
jgi:hypothetical protein